MEVFYGVIRYRCEKCKTLVSENDNYCKECGNDLTKMNILTEDEEFRIVGKRGEVRKEMINA